MSEERPVCNLDSLVRKGDGTYNIRDNSTLTLDPGTTQVIRMEPSEFFRAIGDKEDPSDEVVAASGANFRSAEGLNEAMLNGDPIPIPELEYMNGERKIIGHEGRQRMKIAQKTGVDTVPVKLACFNDDFKRRSCDVDNKIELLLGPRRRESLESEFDFNDERFQEQAESIKEQCSK